MFIVILKYPHQVAPFIIGIFDSHESAYDYLCTLPSLKEIGEGGYKYLSVVTKPLDAPTLPSVI